MQDFNLHAQNFWNIKLMTHMLHTGSLLSTIPKPQSAPGERWGYTSKIVWGAPNLSSTHDFQSFCWRCVRGHSRCHLNGAWRSQSSCLDLAHARLRDVDRGWSGGWGMRYDFRTLKVKPLDVSRETPTAMRSQHLRLTHRTMGLCHGLYTNTSPEVGANQLRVGDLL